MTTRETNLVLAKVAGYHNDSRRFTRLMVEARINRQTLNQAWLAGVRAKEAGVRCLCRDCTPATEGSAP